MRKASAAAAAVLLSCGGIFLWRSGQVARPVPERQPPLAQQPATHPKVDIVFALDTTSSMSGMITAAKAKIWDLARLAQKGQPAPELRVGLVAYRDLGDEYVTRKLDLTPDLDMVYARLSDLTAEGGGDGPEHVLRGLKDSLDDESWSTDADAVKLVYLVGDAPPHLNYEVQDGITVAKVVTDAKAKQIRITGIRCGNDDETLAAWHGFADPTGGEVATIDASGGISTIVTPFDAQLAALNGRLAATEVHTGSATARAAEDEAVRRSLVADPAAQADRAEFFGAAAAAPVGSATMDLVRAAPSAVASARPEDLPDDMRAMSGSERETYVAKKRSERDALVAQVKELSAQRDAFKASSGGSSGAGDKDSFYSKVYHAMKSAGAAKGVSF